MKSCKKSLFLSSRNISMNTPILPASETDLPEILRLAKSLDLDVEDISWKQFLIAKKENHIVGFGRLRNYPGPDNSGLGCTEVATVGVIKPERNKGIGTAIVNELVRIGPSEIYVACVIPDFFARFKFEKVKQYPPALQKKVDFCKCYDFTDDQIFVMKLVK